MTPAPTKLAIASVLLPPIRQDERAILRFKLGVGSNRALLATFKTDRCCVANPLLQ